MCRHGRQLDWAEVVRTGCQQVHCIKVARKWRRMVTGSLGQRPDASQSEKRQAGTRQLQFKGAWVQSATERCINTGNTSLTMFLTCKMLKGCFIQATKKSLITS